MKLEAVAKDLEVARRGLQEIEPEELFSGEQPLDRLAAEVHLPAAVGVDDVADGNGGAPHPPGRRAREARTCVVVHPSIVLAAIDGSTPSARVDAASPRRAGSIERGPRALRDS